MNRLTDATRRKLLKGAAALSTLALAPGVMLVRPAVARGTGKPATSDVRWGLSFF